MTDPSTPTIDVSDMYAVHQVFRDAFGSGAQMVASVGEEEIERQILVRDYLSDVLALLAVHHEGEDELVWPLLRERAPEHSALIDEMEGQHHQIHADLDRAEAALAAWSEHPDESTSAALAAALDAVDATLVAAPRPRGAGDPARRGRDDDGRGVGSSCRSTAPPTSAVSGSG